MATMLLHCQKCGRDQTAIRGDNESWGDAMLRVRWVMDDQRLLCPSCHNSHLWCPQSCCAPETHAGPIEHWARLWQKHGNQIGVPESMKLQVADFLCAEALTALGVTPTKS